MDFIKKYIVQITLKQELIKFMYWNYMHDLDNLFGYKLLKTGYIDVLNEKVLLLDFYAGNCKFARRQDLLEIIVILRSDSSLPWERARYLKLGTTAEPGNYTKAIYDFGHTYGRPQETATEIIWDNYKKIYAIAKEFPMYYSIYANVLPAF